MDSWRGARPNACRRRTRDSDRLLADRCLDPPTPSASPARLLSQPTVLIHLAAALAVWALGLPAQHCRARGGLEVELADVCVDNREALLREHRAIGQTQPVDFQERTTQVVFRPKKPGKCLAPKNGARHAIRRG